MLPWKIENRMFKYRSHPPLSRQQMKLAADTAQERQDVELELVPGVGPRAEEDMAGPIDLP